MSAAIINKNTMSTLSDMHEIHFRKPSSRFGNILLSTGIAIGATFALFMTMEYLIRIEKIELAKAPEFSLRTFIAETPKPNTAEDGYPEIERIPTPIPPATPQIKSINSEAPTLSAPELEKVAPELNPEDLIFSTGVYKGPTTAIAIRQPMPTYPRRAMTQGLSGTCQVAFSLTARGEPFNVAATCSDPIFEASATKAVSKASFSPTKNASGHPVVTHNFVFPLEYRMD